MTFLRLFPVQKLAALEAEEKVRLLKKKIDEDQARIIEAEAKQKSALDLFEGAYDRLYMCGT